MFLILEDNPHRRAFMLSCLHEIWPNVPAITVSNVFDFSSELDRCVSYEAIFLDHDLGDEEGSFNTGRTALNMILERRRGLFDSVIITTNNIPKGHEMEADLMALHENFSAVGFHPFDDTEDLWISSVKQTLKSIQSSKVEDAKEENPSLPINSEAETSKKETYLPTENCDVVQAHPDIESFTLGQIPDLDSPHFEVSKSVFWKEIPPIMNRNGYFLHKERDFTFIEIDGKAYTSIDKYRQFYLNDFLAAHTESEDEFLVYEQAVVDFLKTLSVDEYPDFCCSIF